ncbi:S8 family serine peptidase [uncultured Hymenobacter sp.]|uniref:S8 family peptidase n=1 Tax=uncultured Hymenobacter sp. TaxID=170016 RepID=UPI0035CA7E14
MSYKLWALLLLGGVGLLAPGAAAAQAPVPAPGTVRRHLVFFRDKAGSPFSLARPEAFLSARSLARRARQRIAVRPRDLPVNPTYLARVRAVAGAPQLRYSSRWLNAAVVACDSATLGRVRALPEVSGTQTLSVGPRRTGGVGQGRVAAASAAKGGVGNQPVLAAGLQGRRATYGPAFPQNELLGAVALHEAGFRGEGMQIAVFDAGFPGVNTVGPFQPLQREGRLAGTRNFVDGGTGVFLRDSHGTSCLSTLAANQPGFFVGSAPQATYYLCITEDAGSERPVEEANWLAAAEYADSAGVDVISSSLGYTLFDAPARSYTYADLNGRTALSSRAALEAARVGMLVVSSAGNEGNKAWRYVTAPADADSIISVGAVDSLGRRAAFSSVGPTADGRLKPELVAQGVQTAVLTPAGAAVRGNGTSFAAPTLAGLAAGFWQAHPQLTAQQVRGYLLRSASQAAAPDNLLGYGIPNFSAAQALVPPAALPAQELELYPNPPTDGSGTLRLRLPPAYAGLALRVRITDARGALVRDLALPAPTDDGRARPDDVRVLAVGALAGGSYICRVEGVGNQPARSLRFVQP